jgi:transposase
MMEGKTQEAAAAAAGMSVRTARTWQAGPLPSQRVSGRAWRTRPDPFAGVWEELVVPLLTADKKGELEATTLLAMLEEREPGRFGPGQLRTLQRRLREWRASHGPERTVYFEQDHRPGHQGAFDFTYATELEVTIGGCVLEHLLFVFTLCYSGWTFIQVAFSETYEALARGLQGALWELGGAPEEARSDNLSAATHELKESNGRELNARFGALVDHYRMRSSRIRPGEAHENGVAESRNGRLKSLLAQALVIRGSRDFASIGEWEQFAREVVERRINRPRVERIEMERLVLQPLPSEPVPDYTTYDVRVRRWSTIRVNGRTYSVPSRLIGHLVRVRQHHDRIEVLVGGRVVESFPRLKGAKTCRIDYRHVIHSLVRKPGAFAHYRYREELFPSLTFRRTYDALRQRRGDRADVEYVRILHLAATTMECQVERVLEGLLAAGAPVDYMAVEALARPVTPEIPVVSIPVPDLAIYDALLTGIPA